MSSSKTRKRYNAKNNLKKSGTRTTRKGIAWKPIQLKLKNELELKYPGLTFHKQLENKRRLLRKGGKTRFHPLSFLGDNSTPPQFFPIKPVKHRGGIDMNHAFLISIHETIALKRVAQVKYRKDARQGSWWTILPGNLSENIKKTMKDLVLCPYWYLNKYSWKCAQVNTNPQCSKNNCYLLAGFSDAYDNIKEDCVMKGTRKLQIYIPFNDLNKYLEEKVHKCV